MTIRKYLISAVALAVFTGSAAPALVQKAGLPTGMTLSPSDRAAQEAWWAKRSKRATDSAKPQADGKVDAMTGAHHMSGMSGCCPDMPKSGE